MRSLNNNRWLGLASWIVVIIMILGSLYVALHYYWLSKINGVRLPDEAQIIKTEVSIGDVYGIHVCAEKLICIDMAWDDLKEYVEENNMGGNIHVFPIFKETSIDSYAIEWDDYSMDLNYIKGRERVGKEYYLITNNTPYGSLFYQ